MIEGYSLQTRSRNAEAAAVGRLAAGLEDSCRLLVGGRRRAIPRHQTLLASMRWSHGLLEHDERIMFRRLAAVASGASLGAVAVLREANFIGGGTAHVVALGLFAFLTSREGGFGRPVRVLSGVALVACMLSLSSLFVYQGAAFILLGRLLCMVWATVAAMSLIRRMRQASR
jgi:hypothetical protein